MHETAVQLTCSLIKKYRPRPQRVLEVGSRLINPTDWSPRARFLESTEYLGIDISPGPGIDHVVPEFDDWNLPFAADLTLTINTLEHCARPWIVMEQIERSTDVGGVVIAIAPFAWPVHDYPGDFFRYTGRGLAALMEHAGIEVLECGEQQSMHWKQDAWAVGKVLG